MTEERLREIESITQDYWQWRPIIAEVIEEVRRLRATIATVLADAESQHPGGWGPDVTTVSMLRKALEEKNR